MYAQGPQGVAAAVLAQLILHMTRCCCQPTQGKREFEAFRLKQFAGPHPAMQSSLGQPAQRVDADQSLGRERSAPQQIDQAGSSQPSMAAEADMPVPDQQRVIIHFDVDVSDMPCMVPCTSPL